MDNPSTTLIHLPIDILCTIASMLPNHGLFALRHTSKLMAIVEYKTVRIKGNGFEPKFSSDKRGPPFSFIDALEDGYENLANYHAMVLSDMSTKSSLDDCVDLNIWQMFCTAISYFSGDFRVLNTLWKAPIRVPSIDLVEDAVQDGRQPMFVCAPDTISTIGTRFTDGFFGESPWPHDKKTNCTLIAIMLAKVKQSDHMLVLVEWFRTNGVFIGCKPFGTSRPQVKSKYAAMSLVKLYNSTFGWDGYYCIKTVTTNGWYSEVVVTPVECYHDLGSV